MGLKPTHRVILTVVTALAITPELCGQLTKGVEREKDARENWKWEYQKVPDPPDWMFEDEWPSRSRMRAFSKSAGPGKQIATQGPEINIQIGDQGDVAVDANGNVHIVTVYPEAYPLFYERELYYTMLDGSTGSVLINSTRITPDDMLESTRPAIVVDSQNMVHIVWHDERWPTGPYLTYTKLDPSQDDQDGDAADETQITVVDDIVIANVYWAQNPRMAVDTNDDIHIVFEELFTGIYYMQLDNNNATVNIAPILLKDLSTVAAWRTSVDVALDSNNNPHIAWNDALSTTNFEAYYMMLDGTNGNTLIDATRITPDDGEKSKGESIVVDYQNKVHVIWKDQRSTTDQEVYYTKLDPSLDDQNGDAANEAVITEIDDMSISGGTGEWMVRIGSGIHDGRYIHICAWEGYSGDLFYWILDTDGNPAGTFPAPLTTTGTVWSWSYWTVPYLDVDSNGKAHIVWTDLRNAVPEVFYTTFQGPPFEVQSLSPAANSHTAAPSTNVSATFIDLVDGSTLSDATFVAHSSATGKILAAEGVWSAAGATATLNPNTDFQPGELVQVTATSGVASMDGVPAEPYTWQFTVGVPGGFANYPTGADITTDIYNSESVALGDVDGDGDLDLIAGNDWKINRLYLNDGTGGFPAGTDITTDAHKTYSVALGDVDGDGDLDLIVGNWLIQPNRLYLNDGSGGFPAGADITTDYHQTASVALGDVDGDGDLDLIAGNWGQTNRLYLNDGAGGFSAGADITTDTHSTSSVSLGDADGDGDLDLVAGNYGQRNRLYLNDGSGGFSAGADITTDAHDTYSVALGDLDGDGDLDLIAGNNGQRNRLYLNNGTGGFSTGTDITTDAHQTRSVALGDLDGDGDLDLIAGNQGQNRLYLNDGSGGFPAGADITTDADWTWAVALGDADGDGDLDLIAGNYNQTNRLYLNTPVDFGDAPDPLVATAGQYPTLLANNGPRHIIDTNILLGAAADNDLDGQPSASADGDDTDGTDDEDGVTTAPLTIYEGSAPSITATLVNTTGNPATLSGWIDYDGSGTFDAGEKATATAASGATSATLNFPAVPIAGGITSTFARFRISTDAASVANPTGLAPDGEVEDYPVTINPPVTATIISPNGGQYLMGGAVCIIRWSTTPAGVGTATLKYSTDGGVSYPYTIIATTANDGEYAWTLPKIDSQFIRVKVEIHGSLLAEDESNLNFTIDSTPPWVDLTSPTGGETWIAGGTYLITWSAWDNFMLANNPVSIHYSLDGWSGGPYTVIAQDEPNDGSYAWTIPLGLNSSDFQLKVRVADAAGNASCGHMDSDMTIQPLPSPLAVTHPNGGEVFPGGSSQTILWVSSLPSSTVELRYSLDGGASYPHTIATDEENDGAYSWEVPELDSRSLRVKVRTTGAVSEEDESDGNATVDNTPPTVTLTSLNGGENLEAGATTSVSWRAEDNFGLAENPITLIYSTDGGASYPDTIARGEPNDGECQWVVPSTLSSSLVRIGVEAEDRAGLRATDASRGNLTVQTLAISLSAPSGGEKWRGGSTHAISWNSNLSAGAVTLRYSTDGGASYPNVIAEGEPNDGSYDWVIPEINSQSVRLRIELQSARTASASSDSDFTIDSTPPAVSLIWPNENDTLEAGGTYSIRWTASDNFQLAPDPVRLIYSTDNGTTYPDTIANGQAGDTVFAWTVPADLESESIRMRVEVSDEVGYRGWDQSDEAFTIMPVRLTLISPNGAEVLQGMAVHPIRWESNFPTGTVTLSYSQDGGATFPDTIATALANNGSYDWTVPQINSEAVRVKSTLRTQNITEDVSDGNFKIEHLAPSVVIVSPNGGEQWEAGSVHQILWTATDNYGLAAQPITIRCSKDGGKTFPLTIASDEANDSTYLWSLPPDLISDDLRVRVEALNMKGLTGFDISDENVDIFNPPPVVSDLPDTSFDNSRWLYFCLDPYVRDNNDRNLSLRWSSWVSEPSIQVSINNENKYLTVIAPNYAGSGEVVLTATDPHGASGSDTMLVTVFGSTDVSEARDTSAPTRFYLSQNYPNPFNPETTLSYGLPRESEVRITIYTVHGKKVTDLFAGRKEKGHHTVTWNASLCPSGLYVVQFQAGTYIQTRKCILMK